MSAGALLGGFRKGDGDISIAVVRSSNRIRVKIGVRSRTAAFRTDTLRYADQNRCLCILYGDDLSVHQGITAGITCRPSAGNSIVVRTDTLCDNIAESDSNVFITIVADREFGGGRDVITFNRNIRRHFGEYGHNAVSHLNRLGSHGTVTAIIGSRPSASDELSAITVRNRFGKSNLNLIITIIGSRNRTCRRHFGNILTVCADTCGDIIKNRFGRILYRQHLIGGSLISAFVCCCPKAGQHICVGTSTVAVDFFKFQNCGAAFVCSLRIWNGRQVIAFNRGINGHSRDFRSSIVFNSNRLRCSSTVTAVVRRRPNAQDNLTAIAVRSLFGEVNLYIGVAIIKSGDGSFIRVRFALGTTNGNIRRNTGKHGRCTVNYCDDL